MIKLFEEFNNKKPEVIINYYNNGQKESEEWFLNGKRHREDGPALQWWYENGQKRFELWELNGKLHREDGPAIQRWYDDGEEWYLNGEKYSREEWIEKLKDIGSEHYEEQKMLYKMEKYNL